MRAVLWDERTELIERGELKANQAVRLLHGYTKEDRNGKTELHLGRKSQIEVEPPEKATQYPPLEKFALKISSLTSASGNALVVGSVRAVSSKTTFKRSDASEGTVCRLTLADDSGQITVVAWDEKAEELSNLKTNCRLQLLNARVKESQSGFELHVDSNTAVQVIEA